MLKDVFMSFLMNDESIRKVDTEHYGNIMMLDSIEQIFTVSQALVAFDAAFFSFVGWRGQASLDWPIDSKAVRRLKSQHPAALNAFNDNMLTFNEFMNTYEENLLQRARQGGYGNYYGRNLNDLELLSLIQHYGGSTRLLDFSKSLWVSLWFACADKQDEDGLLICLNIDRLNNNMAHVKEGLTSLKVRDLTSHITDKPVVFEPLHLIPRMKNQHSFFLFGNVVNESWGSLPVHSDNDLTFIGISSGLKQTMRSIWKPLFNFDETYIFDDIEGFSQSHNSNREIDINFQLFG